jgi:hypothetical protein
MRAAVCLGQGSAMQSVAYWCDPQMTAAPAASSTPAPAPCAVAAPALISSAERASPMLGITGAGSR